MCYNLTMKKNFITLMLALFGLLFFRPVFAMEEINSFDAEIKINEDASIDVSEKIEYDFGDGQKHGMFRDIPIKYKARGGNYNLRISEISVADEKGDLYNFSTSNAGQNIRIKIGDADKYVSGVKTYVISYKIGRAMNYFEGHDELYWNVTGNDWEVPIEKASAKISLFNGSEDGIERVCYQGKYGSSASCLISGDLFESQSLYPGEGLTVVFGFPKGIVQKPTAFQNFLATLLDNWILLLPVAVFFLMLYFWWKRGKDPKGRGTIIAQYDAPDEIKPIEVGTVIDNSSDNKDISAEIISLAVRGYLKITKIKEKKFLSEANYELEKLKSEESLEDDFDVKLMNGLFGKKLKVDLSDLKDKFYKKTGEINNLVCDSVVKRGYYSSNPNSMEHLYVGIGVLVALIGTIIFGKIFGTLGAIAVAISGVIIIVFGFLMPARTQKGVLAKEHIFGLKEYLRVAEKDRIKFHNAPEKNPKHFEKLLPFAMVLGVEKEWAEQFKDIYKENPSWYSDPSGANFNALLLANNLNSFSTSANSTLTSNPSSASGGGSGFSGGGGGGFGGGGGGSW